MSGIKIHIKKNGLPAPCGAEKNKCPLQHFDSIEAAMIADRDNILADSMKPRGESFIGGTGYPVR